MKLVADIGNSRLKWAQVQNKSLSAAGSAEHKGQDWDKLLTRLWGGYPPAVVSAVWVANVAGPTAAAAVTAWVTRHWPGAALRFVQATAWAEGVRNAYVEPERLGVDRWAALLAARHAHRGACCIADCGTAVTLDVLEANGTHRGGLIVPGLDAMRSALCQSAQALCAFTPTAPPQIHDGLARDTQSGVKMGSVYAVAALIDRVAEQTGRDVPCFITGGDAADVLPHLRCAYQHMPDLVLQGILILAGEPTCV